MDKDVVHIHNGIQLSCKKKKEIMPSPATWFNLEIIIQSEVGKKKRQMPHDITYTRNLKYSTNKPTNKSTKQKQTLRHREQIASYNLLG